jgi:hypothetical protein
VGYKRLVNAAIVTLTSVFICCFLTPDIEGRRSGNQFAVYVFDRFIVTDLTHEQRQQFSSGKLQGDILTRNY